jgi:hypothetical protein
MQPCGKYCPRANGQDTKKEVYFILSKNHGFSFFFYFSFLHMVPRDVIFGVTAWILH